MNYAKLNGTNARDEIYYALGRKLHTDPEEIEEIMKRPVA